MNETTQTQAETASTKADRPLRSEVILALIAVVVIVGWIFRWADEDLRYPFQPFSDPFTGLSFFGSIAIVAYVVLKAAAVVSMPPKLEGWVLPFVSLIPVLGFLIKLFHPLHELLTIGGSIALAYVSAITYWRRHFLRIAGAGDDKRLDEPASPPPPPPTAAP